MRRYFVGLGLGTLLALGYVQQRVCLIMLGYEVEKVGALRDDLLDQHRVLNYNVLTLKSPVILEERLSKRQVQLAPPTAVEILIPLTGIGTPPSAPLWDGFARSEPSWLERALTFATRWAEDRSPRAIAEPARE